MTRAWEAGNSRLAGRPDAERLLQQFDKVWKTGTPPRIEDFLANDAGRGELLEELIAIDLGYRWRQGSGGKPPILEDYLKRFPELGPAARLSLELIAEEYWARQRWGDRPTHDTYLARFGSRSGKLRETLLGRDAELTAEFRRAKTRVGDVAARMIVAGLAQAAPISVPGSEPVMPIGFGAFVGALHQYQLLSPVQLNELTKKLGARFPEPRALAKELLRRKWLTPYQINQLFLGRAHELLIGSYLVQERLGEGGAGQVFKARHRKMDRVVALKLIRKELLADPEVVGRFYREIQLVGRLVHPNIVHAYDAGPVGATHFLAMEYVEGSDLGKMVKQGGPLPLSQACEYMRQAALALQIAHEHGLVHRDIKPHNFLMSVREGLVKLTDLGLARRSRGLNEERTAVLTEVMGGTGTLTPENAVLIGSVDYMAPEQALDFHAADIRSDIYSLGCTFYYLLTGKPPFASTTLAQKLLKHQQAQPAPIGQFRSDVPAAVAAVLDKMLAKEPKDRYQAPKEAAAALGPFCQRASAAGTKRGAVAPRPRLGQGLLKHRRWLGRLAAGLLLLTGLFLLGRYIFGPNPPAAEQQAVKGLRASARDPKNLDRLRKDILKLRMDYPGTPGAIEAGLMMMALPSPLDKHPGEPGKNLSLPAIGGNPKLVTFSPDGQLLALTDGDSTIRLWDVAAWNERPPALKSAAAAVHCFAFSPDGKYLAAGCEAGGVRLYEVTTPKEEAPFPIERTIRRVIFSPDGTKLAVTGDNAVVELWDVAKRTVLRTIRGQGIQAGCQFSPDGKTLAVISGSNATTSVTFWDVAAGNQVDTLPTQPSPPPVINLIYAPDGKTLALMRTPGNFINGSVYLWDIAAKQPQPVRTGLIGGIFAVFAPDGKLVYGSSMTGVYLWDPVTKDGKNLTTAHGLSLAPDGRHLATIKYHGGDRPNTLDIFRLFDPPKRP